MKAAFTHIREATLITESAVKDRYTPEDLRTIDAVACLSAAGLAHAGGSVDAVSGCGEASGKGWPRHERLELYGELVAQGLGGTPAQRLARLAPLAKDADARVRAVAADAAARIDDAGATPLLALALADADVGVAGATADALAARKPTPGKPVPPELIAALTARATDAKTALEPELRQSLDGALKALGAPVPPPPRTPPAPAPPPGDPAALVGTLVTWTVETTKGTFEVELDPEAAPVSVAALTALAQRGFYDGLLWHRVVPDFVAQGGDPSGSGWGSAGWTLPAEPTAAWYARGAVGIADAGRGTGGCQWFVMHTRVPHLEGRYTWIGRVTKGQDVVDSLLVGDTIRAIAVAVSPRVAR